MAGKRADGRRSSCDAKAAEKKRAGAAKTSFVKKCETDAGAGAAAACDAQAAEKKRGGRGARRASPRSASPTPRK